jgi:phosphoribosylglycinamide formyltransferase-1
MRVVILISGRGSNMQALLEAEALATELPVQFVCVISNKADAAGLQTAAALGVPTEVLEHRAFSDRAAFDAALAARIDAYQPDLVILAGFMRVLTEGFVRHYENRLINVHPALLPAFPGLDTHARALAAGVKLHGCTVHFVTTEVDCGPIIAQAAVPVLADDTPDSLAARVLQQEHRIYPLVVRWLAEGCVAVRANGSVAVTPLQPINAAAALISPPTLPAG